MHAGCCCGGDTRVRGDNGMTQQHVIFLDYCIHSRIIKHNKASVIGQCIYE